MIRKFHPGDIVRVRRHGLEVEVLEMHPEKPGLALCCFLNDYEEYHEVYFEVDGLELIRSAVEKEPAKA